jgi:hypothetical protein
MQQRVPSHRRVLTTGALGLAATAAASPAAAAPSGAGSGRFAGMVVLYRRWASTARPPP